jgi:hypothetical protein
MRPDLLRRGAACVLLLATVSLVLAAARVQLGMMGAGWLEAAAACWALSAGLCAAVLAKSRRLSRA